MFEGSRPGSGSGDNQGKGVDKSPKEGYNKSEREKDLEYLPQAIKYSKMIKGTRANNSTTVKKISAHAARRMAERNISFEQVKETIQKFDRSYPSKKHKNATMIKYKDIVLSYSDNGVVITAINMAD